MRLLSVRLLNVGPFEDTTLRLEAPPLEAALESEEQRALGEVVIARVKRNVTVLFGGSGTGKTSLLAALALTRPGYALPPLPQTRDGRNHDAPSYVVTEWLLGADDPSRPHPLVVTSPSAVLSDESADAATARRREQALFDRQAQAGGGFVFVAFSGARWFSRTANMLTTPERSILRYDVRQAASFDDPTRADLARETKQVLSYAAIGRALGAHLATHAHLVRLDDALRETTTLMLEPFGLTYGGVNPTTLEPEARDAEGRTVVFDALPRPARHLVAFAALTLRALFAAYPGAEAPRECEGVVTIDDAESQQDPAFLRHLAPLLSRALPNVQWIVATASTHLALACEAQDVMALRRTKESRIELSEGVLH